MVSGKLIGTEGRRRSRYSLRYHTAEGKSKYLTIEPRYSDGSFGAVLDMNLVRKRDPGAGREDRSEALRARLPPAPAGRAGLDRHAPAPSTRERGLAARERDPVRARRRPGRLPVRAREGSADFPVRMADSARLGRGTGGAAPPAHPPPVRRLMEIPNEHLHLRRGREGPAREASGSVRHARAAGGRGRRGFPRDPSAPPPPPSGSASRTPTSTPRWTGSGPPRSPTTPTTWRARTRSS